MAHTNFTISTNKKAPLNHFTLSIEGQLKWPRTENPTHKEIINYLKDLGAKEFTKPGFTITPEMITVKLSA